MSKCSLHRAFTSYPTLAKSEDFHPVSFDLLMLRSADEFDKLTRAAEEGILAMMDCGTAIELQKQRTRP